jgi:hypothetical protein
MKTISNSDKTISDALDIAEPINDSIILSDNESDDYNFARKNIRSILERGTVALDRMIEVADLSQHPRSYEVVSTLIKSLSDANKDLLELSEKKGRIEKSKNHSETQTINNNLYISTNELLKLIKDK